MIFVHVYIHSQDLSTLTVEYVSFKVVYGLGSISHKIQSVTAMNNKNCSSIFGNSGSGKVFPEVQ